MKNRFLNSSTNIVALVTLLIYLSVYIPPSRFWIVGFLTNSIPFLILLNVVLAIIWAFMKHKRGLLPLLVILFGYPFIARTCHQKWSKGQDQKGFSILSYNVRVFNNYSHLRDKDYASSKKMISFLKQSKADIICLQESYDQYTSPIFNTVAAISKNYPYYYHMPFFEGQLNELFGMVIYSKYPIVNKGFIKFSDVSNNQLIYADIKVGRDIIRVYDVHLQSMAISEKDMSGFDSTFISRWKMILTKFRNGSKVRSMQVDQLKKHIKRSEYPVLVCGDINDTPYSYTYQSLRDVLNNSFEEAGNGFGFTYNGNLPLRIDNIFADPRLKVEDFKVYNHLKYSDHFPIFGFYSINREATNQ